MPLLIYELFLCTHFENIGGTVAVSQYDPKPEFPELNPQKYKRFDIKWQT